MRKIIKSKSKRNDKYHGFDNDKKNKYDMDEFSRKRKALSKLKREKYRYELDDEMDDEMGEINEVQNVKPNMYYLSKYQMKGAIRDEDLFNGLNPTPEFSLSISPSILIKYANMDDFMWGSAHFYLSGKDEWTRLYFDHDDTYDTNELIELINHILKNYDKSEFILYNLNYKKNLKEEKNMKNIRKTLNETSQDSYFDKFQMYIDEGVISIESAWDAIQVWLDKDTLDEFAADYFRHNDMDIDESCNEDCDDQVNEHTVDNTLIVDFKKSDFEDEDEIESFLQKQVENAGLISYSHITGLIWALFMGVPDKIINSLREHFDDEYVDFILDDHMSHDVEDLYLDESCKGKNLKSKKINEDMIMDSFKKLLDLIDQGVVTKEQVFDVLANYIDIRTLDKFAYDYMGDFEEGDVDVDVDESKKPINEADENNDELANSDTEDENSDKIEVDGFVIKVDNIASAKKELKEEYEIESIVVNENGEESDEDIDEDSEGYLKVDAEDWESLKTFLEDKGVDVAEVFGGDIEVEEETDDEDDEDIKFEDIEDLSGEEEISDENLEEK